MKKNRSFLKWPGNKFRCLDSLLPLFSPAQRWIEPFAGSGTVFLNVDYAQYLLAEVNQDLIMLFQYLQIEGEAFIADCQRFFCVNNNQKSRYYALREQFNRLPYGRERAVLFLYLNRHGYNGLCRYNSTGQYNVPFGLYSKPYFPFAEMLRFYHKSQQAQFLHADFRTTFASAQAGDIIYCDPPYAPRAQNSNFSAYAKQPFQEAEQIELVELAEHYAARGVTVVISNHDTPTTRRYYQQASLIESFPVKRSISCRIKDRLYVQELVAIY